MNLKCVRCARSPVEGDPVFIAPLHGDKGGPLMCIECRLRWDQRHLKDLKQCPEWKRAVHGIDGGLDALFERKFTYLTLELLDDAVALTHPDRHPPDRVKEAQRVTAELLELKPYTLPKPKPKPPPPPVTDNPLSGGGDCGKPLRIDYPCATCFLTVPFYYCDACRKKWDEIQQQDRDRRKEAQKRYRLRRKHKRRFRVYRQCAACNEQFWPRRKDVRFCSNKCRQRQHRQRHHNNAPV
jgi:hypothetical protein